ncbi:HlyD family secretion protein [Pseudodonghicola xiamenensis]|uniref:Hemolysin secretion protein D n=1 Tax=Pseudodonghicola xiamenensis TaxID=337702 RepID=A0A8J3H8H9_9RHOB|nr:HlyD family secretion protein [Pseudodonghicola xiamenensis]GHG93441.1 hemolysin secretion protein D [Pseudodonghicola xiamenensis]
MTKAHVLPSVIAGGIGLAGVLLLLFTWHLPPFAPAMPTTENAYIRGKVTTLAPQLSGYLVEVDVVDFEAVEAGDVIARIDDRIYRQKLAQAEANLEGAKAGLKVAEQSARSAEAAERSSQASLDSARSALENARTTWDRARALQARGITSQSNLDQSDLALQQARAAVRQAEAQLQVQKENINSARVQLLAKKAAIDSADAALALARIDLENTVIRAPSEGRLGQVSARVGQFVAAGTALVSHVGRDHWVIANFKETSIQGLHIGQPVAFSVDALGGQVFHGHVSSFSPATASEFSLLSGSNATGNFTKIAQRLPVRISIDENQDPAALLAPGMSVVVEVNIEKG